MSENYSNIYIYIYIMCFFAACNSEIRKELEEKREREVSVFGRAGPVLAIRELF